MPPEEKLLTRYLILSTDEDAITFTRIGEVSANGSEDAIRKFQADPPVDREGHLVAVSENSFKLRKAKARVVTSLDDVAIPGLAAPTPDFASSSSGGVSGGGAPIAGGMLPEPERPAGLA